MADFARWLVAAEPACPWAEGDFLKTYKGNRDEAIEITLDGDPVADTIKALAKPTWSGTATDLLAELNKKYPVEARPKDWLTKPRQMSDAVKRLAPALRQVGIELTLGKTKDKKRSRIIQLEKKGSDSSGESVSSGEPDSIDQTGGRMPDEVPASSAISSGTSSANLTNVYRAADEVDEADAAIPNFSNGIGRGEVDVDTRV